MYMQQPRLLHVHASRCRREFSGFCRRSPRSLRVVVSPTSDSEDVALVLVERLLGGSAARYLRSSDRRFPLACGGTYFSVSHTQAHTALAVADVPVGVDIEDRLSPQACFDLAWAWSPSEREELSCREIEERLATEIWTAKEAAGKARGTGLPALPSLITTSSVAATSAHRTIQIVSDVGSSDYLDSHGLWHGDSHIRVAWQRER